jgi:hypothetical protein
VVREVLGALPSKSLRAFFVWTPVLESDSREAATLEARLYPDKRIEHFWDGEGRFSQAYGQTLGLAPERAWDVYILYDRKSKTPSFWMHQLREVHAAPFLDAVKLRDKTEELLR